MLFSEYTERIFFIIKSLDWNRLLWNWMIGLSKYNQSSVLKRFDSKSGNPCLVYTLIQSNYYIRPQKYRIRPTGFDWLKMVGSQSLDLIQNRKHLKYNHLGDFAADNFPPLVPTIFLYDCEHFKFRFAGVILKCELQHKIFFADPLDLVLQKYTNQNNWLKENFHQVTELKTKFPIKDSNSTKCGSFCIHIAHLIYDEKTTFDFEFVYLNDHILERFLNHMISH